jgi:hypothetical protein
MEASNCQRNDHGDIIGTTYSSKVIKSIKTIPQAIEIQFADPDIIAHGYGSFAWPAQPLTDEFAKMFINGLDYQYGAPLNSGQYNLYETGSSGNLDPGFFRIVHNGKNIADPTGLGLTPVAMDLSKPVSPPINQCYIDPNGGTFIMPQPIYWSRCEWSENLLDMADIKPNGCVPSSRTDFPPGYTFSSFTDEGYRNHRFNKGYYNKMYSGSGTGLGTRYFYPFGETTVMNWQKGTLSVWITSTATSIGDWWVGAAGQAIASFIAPKAASMFNIITELSANKDAGGLYVHDLKVKINGAVAASANIENGQSYHLYAVWDSGKGLSGGKSMRVFLNGTEVIALANDLPPALESVQFENSFTTYAAGGRAPIGGADGSGEVGFDNIKIWSTVVSESPLWEFQNNFDDGLCPVYGLVNRYRPVLTRSNDGNPANDGGVGFFYIPK